MNNKSIQQNRSIKFLGLHLDVHLTWSTQMDSLLKELGTRSSVIWQLRNKVNLDTLKTYYFAHIQSSINYGILCWGNCSRVNDILITPKKIFRLMLSMPFTASCRELFKQLNILTVPSLYIFSSVTFIKSNPENFIQERNGCSRYGLRLNYNMVFPSTDFLCVMCQNYTSLIWSTGIKYTECMLGIYCCTKVYGGLPCSRLFKVQLIYRFYRSLSGMFEHVARARKRGVVHLRSWLPLATHFDYSEIDYLITVSWRSISLFWIYSNFIYLCLYFG